MAVVISKDNLGLFDVLKRTSPEISSDEFCETHDEYY